MYEIFVSNFGTIRGDKDCADKFQELTISQFINKIAKSINVGKKTLDTETFKFKIEYSTMVNYNGNYNGNDSYYIRIMSKEYILKLDAENRYCSFLKDKLDYFARVSGENLSVAETIHDFETDTNLASHRNVKDVQTYLNFLRSCKAIDLRKLVVKLLAVGIANCGTLFLTIVFFMVDILFGGFLFAALLVVINGLFRYDDVFKKIANLIKVNGLLKFKIDKVMLDLAELKMDELCESRVGSEYMNLFDNVDVRSSIGVEKEVGESKSEDSQILGYFNELRKKTNSLDVNNCRAILCELKALLGEYCSKMVNCSKKTKQGLTLDDGELAVERYIINKLVDVDQRIKELVAGDARINAIRSSCGELMEIFDSDIASLDPPGDSSKKLVLRK